MGGMTPLLPLLLAASASPGAAPLPALPGTADTTTPILIVVIDDVGWNLVEDAQTPTLDTLMTESVVFHQAWAYPVCSPTRASLLTGRHPFRHGVGSNLKPDKPKSRPGLALSEQILPEVLPGTMDAFGKWHVSYRVTDPINQGFNQYAGAMWNLDNRSMNGYYDWTEVVNGVAFQRTDYATTVTTDRALASTADIRLVSYHACHRPPEPPPGGTPGDELHVTVQMLEYLDAELGRLIANFNGYLFLISDNGSVPNVGGGKGSLKESGIRVPIVARGPGWSPAMRDDLVGVTDLMATLCEIRGVACPGEDSISFLRALEGGPRQRKALYSEKFNWTDQAGTHQRAIRNRNWKIIIKPSGTIELYSMIDDSKIDQPWSASEQTAVNRLLADLPN